MIWVGLGVVLIGVHFSLRYAWWRRSVPDEHPRILMYHMVSAHRPRARFNKLRVPPDAFDRQVRWLAAEGYTFAFMSEIGPDTPSRVVAITFDDGYRDNLEHADAVLERHGAKATLYLVVDRHDRDWSSAKKAHHDDGELMREPKLTDEEVRALLATGRWELAGHTLTHAHLPSLTEAERRMEILEGRQRLEAVFDVAVDSFAYPFGHYEAGDVDIVREAGYRTACTTEEGITTDVAGDALELKRVKVSGKDGQYAFTRRVRSGHRGWPR